MGSIISLPVLGVGEDSTVEAASLRLSKRSSSSKFLEESIFVVEDKVAGVVLLSSEDCLNMVFFRIGVDAIDRAVDSVLFLTGDDIFRWESFRKKEFLLCPSSELRLEESKILGTFLDRKAMLVSIPFRCFVFALVLDSFSIVFYVYTNSVLLMNSK